MMKKNIFISTILLTFLTITAFGQEKKTDSTSRKFFVSSSLWSFRNLGPDAGDFYELNFGYSLTDKDNLILNATTWKYPEPLGIPLGNENKYAKTQDYPGYIRAWGLGVIYQRFLWKKSFVGAHAHTFLQNFYDEQNEKIQSGFQLYLQFRLGYRFTFLKDRLFLEPSLSFNTWPINTNFPEEFQQLEENWPSYFLFEPHFNVGFLF